MIIFYEPGYAFSAADTFLRLRQGTLTFGQYAIQFCTLSAEFPWNNEVLTVAFWQGLVECIGWSGSSYHSG